jgi:hypothetical protein
VSFIDLVKAALIGGKQLPFPQTLYRGVHKNFISLPDPEGFVHVTPWKHIAERAGKFGGYDPDIVIKEYPVLAKQKYYRGGSLAGDPFERTRIGSPVGLEWDELADQAEKFYRAQFKQIYKRDRKRLTENYTLDDLLRDIQYESVDNTIRNLVNAAYETDVMNKAGKWVGRTDIPLDFFKELPRLRHIREVEALDRKWRLANPGLRSE